MKRPRQRKTTEEVIIDVPKEDIYRLCIWCRGQDHSFDLDGTLEKVKKSRNLLMTEGPKRIELDNTIFRSESIDAIKINKL